MRRTTLALLALAAALVTAGGGLHLHDWLRTYRGVPWDVPGAWVVRVGFPVNAAVSVAAAVGLVAAALRFRRLLVVAISAAIGLQLMSIGALVLSRHGGVLGWVEPGWTTQARQVLAVEIAAVVMLVGAQLGRVPRRQLLRRSHSAVAAAPAGVGPFRVPHDVEDRGARLLR